MRLVSYRYRSFIRLGALLETWVVDLERAYQAFLQASDLQNEAHTARLCLPVNMLEFLRAGKSSFEAALQALDYVTSQADKNELASLCDRHVLIPFAEVSLCAPILAPGKVICIGGNYPSGIPGSLPPPFPIIFLKPASAVIGPEEAIQIPPVTGDVAYEAELVVVIGARAKYLAVERAFEFVAGYTQANDVGARDLEKRTSQWTSGKLMDTFCPLGPALVTPDEIRDPGNLPVVTLLNDQVVQRGDTGDMYFNIPELISYVSQLTTLEPGDLILTGSPKTIDGQPAPTFSLKPGDCVDVMIGNLGILHNQVIAEQLDGWKP